MQRPDDAHDRLDRREADVALQLDDVRCSPIADDACLVARRPDALGAPGHERAVRADGRARREGRREGVQVHGARQVAADGDAAHAVAARIHRRRPHGDAELPRQHGEDAARDAALGRQAHADEPLTRAVVHAAAGHDREDGADRSVATAAWMPVTGLRPPAASVAAMTATSRTSTWTEHCRK